MNTYYLICRAMRRYYEIRAYRISDARNYAKLRYGIRSPLVEDCRTDIPKTCKFGGLSELPANYQEQLELEASR